MKMFCPAVIMFDLLSESILGSCLTDVVTKGKCPTGGSKKDQNSKRILSLKGATPIFSIDFIGVFDVTNILIMQIVINHNLLRVGLCVGSTFVTFLFSKSKY